MAAYPVADDVIAWLGNTATPDTRALAGDILDEVLDYWLDQIPTAALGTESRPDGASPDCPARMRRALIMHAARIVGRRSSRGGFEVFGDTTAYVRTADPDIDRMMSGLVHWPTA